MKLIFFKSTFLLFILINLATLGQTADSSSQISGFIQEDTSYSSTNSMQHEESDDFSPGLLFFAMIGIAFILFCVGAGIVVTVIGLLIIFGLVSIGTLSASIIIGLNRKSFAKGFKTFIVSTSAICGFIFCGLGFWLLNKIAHWWASQTAALITGSICGLIAGLIFGLFVYYILQLLTTYFKQKLKII